MLPRHGTSVENILARLREFTITAYNATEPMAYADWVTRLETALRECFTDVPLNRLYTERFWQLNGPLLRRQDMLRNEQRDLVDWLERVVGSVQAMSDRFSQPAGSIVVLDTHVLLHAKPLHEIKWSRLVGSDEIRLVVPLRVVDEMDEHKYARRDDLRKRARKRLPLLERHMTDESGTICPGVNLEVVSWRELDVAGGVRPQTPVDIDILDTCEAISVYALNNAVHLGTADSAMKLRARSFNVPVVDLLSETDSGADRSDEV